MNKSRLFKTFATLVLIFVFAYIFLKNNQATQTTQVSAFVDETKYEVYSGRQAYEYYRSILN